MVKGHGREGTNCLKLCGSAPAAGGFQTFWPTDDSKGQNTIQALPSSPRTDSIGVWGKALICVSNLSTDVSFPRHEWEKNTLLEHLADPLEAIPRPLVSSWTKAGGKEAELSQKLRPRAPGEIPGWQHPNTKTQILALISSLSLTDM